MSCCNQITKGVVGLTKAVLGIDRADEQTIEARRSLCRSCDRAEPCIRNAHQFCICKECGCLLKAKTSVKSEVCPIGRW